MLFVSLVAPHFPLNSRPEWHDLYPAAQVPWPEQDAEHLVRKDAPPIQVTLELAKKPGRGDSFYKRYDYAVTDATANVLVLGEIGRAPISVYL